jgi:hypothetical protein
MEIFEFVLTKKQYEEFVDYYDSDEGVTCLFSIALGNRHPYNKDLVLCRWNKVPDVHESELFIKFDWLIGALAHWFDFQRELQAK